MQLHARKSKLVLNCKKNQGGKYWYQEDINPTTSQHSTLGLITGKCYSRKISFGIRRNFQKKKKFSKIGHCFTVSKIEYFRKHKQSFRQFINPN